MGSGCGTVGRAVTSDTRDLRFESQAKFYRSFVLFRKDENKEKEPGIGPLKFFLSHSKSSPKVMGMKIINFFLAGVLLARKKYMISHIWPNPAEMSLGSL